MLVNSEAGVVQFTVVPLAVQPAIADCATSPVIIPRTDSRMAAERGFNLEEGMFMAGSWRALPQTGAALPDITFAAPFSTIDAPDELASRQRLRLRDLQNAAIFIKKPMNSMVYPHCSGRSCGSAVVM
jgi:hypothetical protein